jgi:hypothetical protein
VTTAGGSGHLEGLLMQQELRVTNSDVGRQMVSFRNVGCDLPSRYVTISEGVVVVYLDDILIFTKDLEEHRRMMDHPSGAQKVSGTPAVSLTRKM